MKLTTLRRLAFASTLLFSTVHAADMGDPTPPFQLLGNSYYVGLHGIASVLITSPQGHILIDGGYDQSAQQIAAAIRALGFKVEDIKLILNSHVHPDHAGGIAELQRLSGATVVSSPAAIAVLKTGQPPTDDPQLANLWPFPPVGKTQVVADGEAVHVGPLAVTALYTPGHTSSGMSWAWTSCDAQSHCARVVFADSLNPIAAQGYKFSAHPAVVQQYERSYATLDKQPCDVLVPVHPDGDALRSQAGKGALVGSGACQRYAAESRDLLNKRLAQER